MRHAMLKLGCVNFLISLCRGHRVRSIEFLRSNRKVVIVLFGSVFVAVVVGF